MLKKMILIFSIVFLFTSLSWAKFKLGPSYYELSLKSGESVEKEIFIENADAEQMELMLLIEPFLNSTNNKKVLPDQWLTIDKSSIIVKGKTQKLLKFKVTCPKDLKGEVSAKLGFIEKGTAGAMVHTELSSFIYLIALDNSIIGAEISKFQGQKTKEDNIKFDITIKNTGNIHIRPKGTLQILNDKNQLIQKIELPESSPIFENKEYKLVSKDDVKKLADGQYLIKANISLGYNDAYNILNDYKLELNGKEVKIESVK